MSEVTQIYIKMPVTKNYLKIKKRTGWRAGTTSRASTADTPPI
jgi:hypothetical protein